MKCVATIALVFACLGSAVQEGAAETLTFEGLTTSTQCCIPGLVSYGGLSWHNFQLAYGPHESYVGNGYDNGRVSGQYTAFNALGNPAAITGGSMTFNSAYFTSAWNTGLNLNIGGWNGTTQLFATTLVLNTAAPIRFIANWSGIDRLTFTSFGGVNAGLPRGEGVHFAMDDFVFAADAAPVPEPASMLLLATGLSAVSARRWQHRRRVSRLHGQTECH